MCDYVRTRHYRSPSGFEVQRPGLNPPRPTVRINNNPLLGRAFLTRPEIVSTRCRPPCAAGGIWVNSIEGPESALCDWQPFGGKPSAAIAARKLGPIVAVACAPTIDCRMREGRGALQSA